MEPDRLNSPSTFTMDLELMGNELQVFQDPNSKHLGTTVWDASLVFAKFLEKNSRRGKFSREKLKGKRVIELGAGCGVAGFGMALLGCDVIMTDQVEVLSLLMRNVERNTSRIKQINSDSVFQKVMDEVSRLAGLKHLLESFGSIQVAELSWGNKDHVRAVDPPFDYVIGTDVVYKEDLLEPLLQTIFALSGPKTVIMLGYEIRSTSVHEQMVEMWKRHFELKLVPNSKMDSTYQHPSIQLFIMKLKPPSGYAEKAVVHTDQDIDEEERADDDTTEVVDEKVDTNTQKVDYKSVVEVGSTKENSGNVEKNSEPLPLPQNGELTEWEARSNYIPYSSS